MQSLVVRVVSDDMRKKVFHAGRRSSFPRLPVPRQEEGSRLWCWYVVSE